MEPINISEVKRRFSELVSRASAGERFLIGRRGRPLAVLLSADELERIERTGRAGRLLAGALGQSGELLDAIVDGREHPAMAAFGLWRDMPELDDLGEEIRANRDGQPSRPDPAAAPCP